MFNLKKLLCNHDYKFYGLYYIKIFYYKCTDFYYKIYGLHICTKCGKTNNTLVSTKYFKYEITDNVLTKEEMYNKIYGEQL